MDWFWPIVGLAVVIGAVVAAVAGLMVVHRLPAFEQAFHDNEVAGILFGVMGVLFGALLAFVVFATWERFATAQESVVSEAAAALVAYRDTQDFPEPQKTDAQAAFRAYVQQVIDREWASHGSLTAHINPDALNPLWTIYRSVPPTSTFDEIKISAALDRLHALEDQRHLRHLAGEATLPWIFWPLLAFGGTIMVVFSYFLYHGRLRAQALMTGIATAMTVGVLILIYSINQPFTGPVQVSKYPLQHALLHFDAIDIQK